MTGDRPCKCGCGRVIKGTYANRSRNWHVDCKAAKEQDRLLRNRVLARQQAARKKKQELTGEEYVKPIPIYKPGHTCQLCFGMERARPKTGCPSCKTGMRPDDREAKTKTQSD